MSDTSAKSRARFPSRSPRSAVHATVGLIVILFALFVAILAYSTLRAYDEAEARARDRALAAAQVVEINAKWIVELAQQALRRIDESLGPQITDGTGSTVRDLREAVNNLPGTVKAYVADAQGDTLFSTDPSTKPARMADRSYFSELAAGDRWHTSSLMLGSGGEQIFVFSRRIERNGEFAGAAIISFDVMLFEEVWRSIGMDTDSTVSIIRDDGQLVARYPLSAGPLDMSNYVLFTEYLKEADSGVYFAVSPADGARRHVAYRKIYGTELVAVASVSAAAALTVFWENTLLTLLLALPTGIGLAAASIWIVRLLQRDARRQDELAKALELNRLLFRDTHHRVKNNLQSVQSLVRMQNIPTEAKVDLQRRIAAMTAVHEHMYRLDQYLEVDAADFIPAIVEPLIESFDSPVAIHFDLVRATVDRDHTTALALLVNEVVTNALKYAFPAGVAGNLWISLQPAGDGRARLSIRDDGVGFDAAAAKQGMGSRLIRAMVQQLEGEYAYRIDGGTLFEAEFALPTAEQPMQAREAA